MARDLRTPLTGVVALCAWLARPWLPSSPDDVHSISLWVLPPLVVATLVWLRPGTPREQAFRRYWLAALVLWWLSAMLDAASAVAAPWADGLWLLGHAAVVLALTTRPHRAADERMTGPVRQLQFAATLIAVDILVIYGPGLAAGGLDDVQRGSVDLVVAGVVAWLLGRPTTRPWRSTYVRLAVGFVLFAIAEFTIKIDPRFAVVAVGLAWTSLAGVPRWAGVDEAVDDPWRSEDDRRLPFEIPVLLVALVVPGLHIAFDLADVRLGGWADPQVDAARDALAFAGLAVLGALAILEHALLRHRATRLEHARARAADEGEERSIYLSSLIEHSPLAIVVLDPEHVVQLCNPAFEKLFHYSSDEVVGTSLDRLIAPGAHAIEARGYTRRVLGGEAVHDTTHRLRRDGTPVDVEIHGVPLLKDGRLVGIFALYQDVTERIRAEQALRESEERFRRLSDATFEGIVVSEAGRVVDCNEQYARMVGLPQREVVGRKVLDFVDPVDHPMVRERLDREDDQPYEHRALRADRSARVVEVRGRNMPWEGRLVRVAAVRDVTDQRRFEEEVRQSQKMEAVGRLAGGIAHDFNNLLTVIKGYAQLLVLQMQGDRRGDLVEEIVQATDRASLMTQRLLAFGRKQPFQPQTLDLGDAVRSMQKILRRLIRADIELVLDLAEDIGRARVDPGQFEQVLLNLAINAADAMPDGGTLTLATEAVESTSDGLLPAGRYVRLRVRDTGTGMDEEIRAQVFEPFFTTKGQGKGTGLGLATVYAIVHQSGGTIDVESEPGEGAEFVIVWPRVPEGSEVAAPSVTVPERPSDLPAGHETVLVVEDEQGVRILAREFLELHGYRVHVAVDGSDGLKRFAALGGAIDLVLTDVVMPGMNGPEMVRELRGERPDLKVLYMSGYTDEVLDDAERSVARLVHKPFSVEDLVTRVREVLDGETVDPEAPTA